MNAMSLRFLQAWWAAYAHTHHAHLFNPHRELRLLEHYAFGATNWIVALVLLAALVAWVIPVARRDRHPHLSPSIDVLMTEQQIAIKERRLAELDHYSATTNELYR